MEELKEYLEKRVVDITNYINGEHGDPGEFIDEWIGARDGYQEILRKIKEINAKQV